MAEARGIPSQGMTEQFTENADGSLDCKVLVLSGTEMFRDEIGSFVIDLESAALHKPTLIVDYNHEEGEVIGQISNLRYEDGGLFGDAHLFSARSGDRAEEVILRILGGTPYEISPTVQFAESEIEEVAEGFAEVVNGRTVPGPAVIFRKTPIRGVSICPYGTDRYTGVLKLKLEKAGEKRMADTTDNGAKTPEAAHPDLEAMISEFGETDGLNYYRQGLSLEEAQQADYAQLKAERAARLAAEKEPEAEPEGGDGGGEGGGEGGGDPAPEPEAKPESGPEPEKEKDGLSAVLDGLKALGETLKASLDKQAADINTLKAALRRGEDEPVAPTAGPAEDKRDAVHRMADRIKATGITKQQ